MNLENGSIRKREQLPQQTYPVLQKAFGGDFALLRDTFKPEELQQHEGEFAKKWNPKLTQALIEEARKRSGGNAPK